MLMTFDIEDYKRNKETGKFEPILDATGKYFKIGCTLKETGGKKVFTEKEEMWKYIIEEGKKEIKREKKLVCYAHNAKFDFFQIMDRKDKNLKFFSENPLIASYYFPVEREFTIKKFENWKWYAKREKIDYEIIMQSEELDLVSIRYLKEGIKFLDTLAIFRMALKKVGEIIDVPKTEMPIEIGTKLTKKKIKEISKYCLNDCHVTLEAIKFIKEKLKEDGINIRNLCTINQIAISYVLNKLKENGIDWVLYVNKKGEITDWTWKTRYKEEIHSAYRGGYVRAWKTGFYENATSIDVNSLYPYSAIKMRFPDLRTERKIKDPLANFTREELFDKIGLSRAVVINKNNDLGLLPIRTPEKSYIPKKGKMMIGTWTHTELAEAIKEGYDVLNIEWSIIFDEAENPFKKIYTEIYKKRMESHTKFDNFFYKSILNSSLGKFGQRKTDQIIVIDSVEKIYEYLNKNYKMIRGIDGTTDIMFVNRDLNEGRVKKYYAPIIPALVTAYARVEMYKHFKKIPIEDLLYTDTDSCLYLGDHLDKFDIGEKLGQFKVDKDIVTGEELRNTRFICWGTKSKSIGNNIAVSGVFKSGLTMEDFAKGKVTSRKMLGLKNQDEGKIGEFIIEERDLKEQQKRFWETEEKLGNEDVLIDFDIDDITYFKNELMNFN